MNARDRQLLHAIGRNLAAGRARAGRTQEQVAHTMGVAPQQYSRIERGEFNSGITVYVHAARAIGMRLTELFDRMDGDDPVA